MSIPPIAPYTSVLRYPGRALISLARKIINDLDEHHQTLFEAAEKAEDDDQYEEQGNTVIDISGLIFAFDRMKWKERVEKAVPDWKQDPSDYIEKGPPELPLFTTNSIKAEWVMNAAVERRRETRRDPPSEDPEWFKEDALLDFLLFLSKDSHRGLFAPVETDGCACASRYHFGVTPDISQENIT